MAITTAQYEKISQFLDANMDVTDMDDFQAELVANPEMRQQLDFEIFVRDGLAFNSTVKINNGFNLPKNKQTSGIEKKVTTPNVISLKRWLVTGVAASIILAFSIAILFNQQSKKNKAVADKTIKDTASIIKDIQPNIAVVPFKDSIKTIDESALFKKYYTKDKLPENYPIFLADAFTRYEAGDYSGLQQLNLSDLPETRGSNGWENKEKIVQLAHYYKGISYLETGSTAKAVIHFNRVLQNKPDKALLTKTEWFLALACLKEHEAGKAKELLKKIIGNSQENEFSRQAKALLNLLETGI